MNPTEIIKYISESEKKTPVKVYLKSSKHIDFPNCKTFSTGDQIIFGDWKDISPLLDENKDSIDDFVIEQDRRNSGVPLLDILNIPARIEPGAIIREKVNIEEGAIIMMGAVINIGASVGKGSMIDMGAVLGGRAQVGNNCHIGAGAVLAGVIEPASATPVIVEDNVLIGANAVVIEGVRIGKDSVIAAGAIVTKDVPSGSVVAGNPAKIVKMKDEKTKSKTELIEELRNI